MLVGHYAGAFLARAYEKRIPLAAAFVAAQLVDFGWDACILAGVEHARLVPGLPSNPLDLYFMPYTHGLAATGIWAAAAFALVKATKLFGGSTKVAAICAATVASHWFLDLVVHRHDLPLLGDDSPKLGLELWNQPVLALVVEVGVLAAAAAVYVARTRESATWIFGLVAALSVIQVVTVYGPLPPTIPMMAGSLFVAYIGFALLALNVQRRASRSSS